MDPNRYKKVHSQKKKKYTQSQTNRCKIIKVTHSRDEYEAEHKIFEIHNTYLHNQGVTQLLHFISEPFVELRSEADDYIA